MVTVDSTRDLCLPSYLSTIWKYVYISYVQYADTVYPQQHPVITFIQGSFRGFIISFIQRSLYNLFLFNLYMHDILFSRSRTNKRT